MIVSGNEDQSLVYIWKASYCNLNRKNSVFFLIPQEVFSFIFVVCLGRIYLLKIKLVANNYKCQV